MRISRLSKPAWPTPEIGTFIRGIGGISYRKRRGIVGPLAEEKVCLARRAFSLASRDPICWKADPELETHPGLVFRRAVFDGSSVGRFEAGFWLPIEQDVSSINDIRQISRKLLLLSTTVRQPFEKKITCALGDAGPLLAKLFEHSTTPRKVKRPDAQRLKEKPPAVCSAGEPVMIVSFSKMAALDGVNETYGSCNISTFVEQSKSGCMRFIVINEANKNPSDLARNLRLFLTRIHTELFSLETALNAHTEESKTIVEAKSDLINELVQRLGRSASAFVGLPRETAIKQGFELTQDIWGERLNSALSRSKALLKTPKDTSSPKVPEAPPPVKVRVFISYRRQDEPFFVDSLYKKLRPVIGADNLFYDLYSIAYGMSFPDRIETAIGQADAVFVVVGKDWVGMRADGSRRIDDTVDYVRSEVELALKLKKKVVPVIVGQTPFPPPNLPVSLNPFTTLNGIHVEAGHLFEEELSQIEKFVEDLGQTS